MLAYVLYMVIEHLADTKAVYERFAAQGRMLPDGLRYVDSWVVDTPTMDTCYQLMETDDLTRELCEEAAPTADDLSAPMSWGRNIQAEQRKAIAAVLVAAGMTGLGVGVLLSRYHPTPVCIGVGLAVAFALVLGWTVAMARPYGIESGASVIGLSVLAAGSAMLLAWDGRDHRVVTSTYVAGLVFAVALLCNWFVSLFTRRADLARYRAHAAAMNIDPELEDPEGRLVDHARWLHWQTRYQLS